ncbi:MAG: hypothetical protein K2X81_11375 [Candidatus Obscuribacterales bacterium]|nr:hypothetical protein [Candidatus Obscuribacterales bacterium]
MKNVLVIASSLILCASLSIIEAGAASDSGEQAVQSKLRTQSKTEGIVYQDWQDSKRGRAIPVKIFMPGSGSAPFPIVIFSHGLGGSREAAAYLGDYWSKHGYLGVFVQHPGSDSAVWQNSIAGGRQGMMQSMKAAANGKNLIDRVGDIKFVLDELERRNQSDPALKSKLDLSKIALAGHSFGAGTTLAIAGQEFGPVGKNLATADKRVKSAIYLCPPVMGGDPQSYANIQVPGMLLTGTEDNSPIGGTKAEDRRIPFDGIKSVHQYLVNFIGADHATFGGRSFRAPKPGDEKFHEMIDELTTKFLDATLKVDASALRWLDSAEVTSYLGKSAKFERK